MDLAGDQGPCRRRRAARRIAANKPDSGRERGLDQSTKPILRVNKRAIYNAQAMPVINLPDEAATAAFASRIAAQARPGDVIALRGDLGAGKTSFARAFIRARGDADEEVPSPTFTLVQIYQTGAAAIWHFDLYRLGAAHEAWELGIEEAFAAGISLIEWPERLGSLLPQHRLEIALAFGAHPQARRATCTGGADWPARLAEFAADG